MSLEALPPISESAMPREVREGSADDKKAYRAALGFERMLLRQLTEQIAESTQGSGDEDSESAGQGAYRSMVADSLADAIATGGGLGLAKDMYRSARKEPTL